jgi:hypothetical protein
MLYRTRRNLRVGKRVIPRGALVELDKPEEVIAKLKFVGAITEIRFPPLEALPGWEARAVRLREAGIESVEALLRADPMACGQSVGEPVSVVEAWQEEARVWLTPRA